MIKKFKRRELVRMLNALKYTKSSRFSKQQIIQELNKRKLNQNK